ncbi:MAG: hypothetical protein POELPBGB_02965 [Bacteroidia bacterium]|nr:hypothetical protein [Bacteroidia bacterium]
MIKYTNFTKEERNYWKNLHVNIDAFCDKWEVHQKKLTTALKIFNPSEIDTILKYYPAHSITKQNFVTQFASFLPHAIDFYCVLKFSLFNPKAISQLYNIPIRLGEIDKPAVFLKILEEHKGEGLPQVFLKLKKLSIGKGNFRYNFDEAIKEDDFPHFVKAMPLLVRNLNRIDTENKGYHFRSSSYSKKEWHFLLLKELSDVILPAIPENVRVVKGDYIFLTIIPEQNVLEINTKSKIDAYKIRQYLSFKRNNTLTYRRNTANYNAKKFLTKVVDENQITENLKLFDVEFRNTNLQKEIRVTDPSRKNDIIAELHSLKDKNIIKLDDLSEFKSLTFYYKGISFKIKIEENKWGQLRLNVLDKGKPKIELIDFQKQFEDQYNIPLNIQLKNEDSLVDIKKVTRKLFEHKTIQANIPEDVEDVLLDLIKLKLTDKPGKSAKRRCSQCRKITWEKGDCPECGNELFIEGDYIDLKPNPKGIYNWLFKVLFSRKEIATKRIKKQIDSISYPLIDIFDKKGAVISIYISTSNVPDKIIKHYQETGSPLLVVLIKYKEALFKDIIAKGFECIDITDLYAQKDNADEILSIITASILSQKHKWQEKIIQKGYNSYTALKNKGNDYHDQNFERDIFNVIHEIFLIGDRLGGKFAGIPAPDGIVSIQNYGKPLKRYCFSWDCKFSTAINGYQLRDPASKHRKYIYSLKKNDKVLFYGGLGTYAIISQNMDMTRYEEFYAALVKGFRWKGTVLFIQENQITNIYKLYKDNESLIQNEPYFFYSNIHALFKVIWKKNSIPFKFISEERLYNIFDKIKSHYMKIDKPFVFERTEF